jgi:hypothetical protein
MERFKEGGENWTIQPAAKLILKGRILLMGSYHVEFSWIEFSDIAKFPGTETFGFQSRFNLIT